MSLLDTMVLHDNPFFFFIWNLHETLKIFCKIYWNHRQIRIKVTFEKYSWIILINSRNNIRKDWFPANGSAKLSKLKEGKRCRFESLALDKAITAMWCLLQTRTHWESGFLLPRFLIKGIRYIGPVINSATLTAELRFRCVRDQSSRALIRSDCRHE